MTLYPLKMIRVGAINHLKKNFLANSELDLRNDWDFDNTGESRKYYLEIEADGDGQSYYFLVYQPKREDLSSSWKNKGGIGEVEVYEDRNNSIGGNNPTGADSGDSDGYESDLSSGKNLSSGDFHVRLVDGNVQIALKKSKIGTPSNKYLSKINCIFFDKVLDDYL